ncbi:hypothetical protein TSMEX_011051 [Taenia solium]|eukprot:TsM_000235600 transcript=TsM_000235600 gene=TsM_000235600
MQAWRPACAFSWTVGFSDDKLVGGLPRPGSDLEVSTQVGVGRSSDMRGRALFPSGEVLKRQSSVAWLGIWGRQGFQACAQLMDVDGNGLGCILHETPYFLSNYPIILVQFKSKVRKRRTFIAITKKNSDSV